MEITLEKAVESDARLLLDMQVESFLPLLKKYKDYDTNPANETIERLLKRINNPQGGFYKILAGNAPVGAICGSWKVKEEARYWIGPMFIRPEHQGKGIAQQAIHLIIQMFPQAISWELATIAEEERNCYLYEKMGFVQTGVRKPLNDRATLVFYQMIQEMRRGCHEED
ncbi:GNAT family N-acetyltransferase [Paenibacillus sp. PL2-23]|uniref:GNAT family N-acetyltransferase n=1 Tax=Paenibacillus sp. PL2-23 TaxID=2100729 RepID=UPI0030F7442F